MARILGFLLVTFFFTSPSFAEDTLVHCNPCDSVLRVIGKNKFEIRPDYAIFYADVVSESVDLTEITRLHEKKATQASEFLQSLKEMGLEVLGSDYLLDREKPQTAQAGAKPTVSLPLKYRSKTSFKLKANSLLALDTLVTKLVRAELFEISQFRFKTTKEREALLEARKKSVADAIEQAQTYAETVKMQLVDILEITDGEAVIPDGYADMPSRRALTVQIIPPSVISADASVRVTWKISSQKAP